MYLDKRESNLSFVRRPIVFPYLIVSQQKIGIGLILDKQP
jgi:hypothetical protein